MLYSVSIRKPEGVTVVPKLERHKAIVKAVEALGNADVNEVVISKMLGNERNDDV